MQVIPTEATQITPSTSASRKPAFSSRWRTGSPTRWPTAPRSSACRSGTARRAARSGKRWSRPSTTAWWWSPRPGTQVTRRARAGADQAPESFPAQLPGRDQRGRRRFHRRGGQLLSSNLSVKVAAPGVSVPAQGRDQQYWWVSGTSPACALVAGVAALIKSRYPDLVQPGRRRADLHHHRPAGRRV